MMQKMRGQQGLADCIRRWIAPVLILVGILVILGSVSVRVYAGYRSDLLISLYSGKYVETEDGTAAVSDAQRSKFTVRKSDVNSDSGMVERGEDEKGQRIAINGIEVVGLLSIPKIDLMAAIGEGSDRNTLRYAVGHIEGTALPGMYGNCCIAGHRNYSFGEFFNRLDEIEAGDELILTSTGKTYLYKVTDTFVVTPTDIQVMDQGSGYELTLITCTPIYKATHRLIVKAELFQEKDF